VLHVVFALAALLTMSSTAWAQTRVRVVRDRATIWLPGFVTIGTVVSAGTELEVRVRRGNWYEVLFPVPGTSTLRIGMIAVNQVAVLAGGSVPLAAPARRPPGARGLNRFGMSAGTQPLRSSSALTTSPVYLETASYNASYVSVTAPMIDIGGAQFNGHFGGGAWISYASRSQAVSITGAIPHPFVYDTPRAIEGSAEGFRHRETALHIQVLVRTAVGRRLEVSGGAGPSFFTGHQDLVSSVAFTEEYPYDAAVFDTASSVDATASGWGFNVGADATFWVSRTTGVGAIVRFSRGSVEFAPAGQPTTKADLGGLFVGFGVRASF
jgi:hypothetical protein